MRIVIGSRKSDLARLQSYRVAEALKKIDSNLEIEFHFKSSMGDQNLDQPLWKLPQKGVFTEDFVQDLHSGRVDMVVHSWKDLPVEPREGSQIAATLKRADPRDLLLYKKDRMNKPNLKILSSSPRRAYNLRPFFSWALPFQVDHVDFENIRGNVPTRFRRMMERDEADGMIMAKAALDRLMLAHEPEFEEMQKQLQEVLEQCEVMVLPLSVSPAAAAQGALAIEVMNHREDLLGLVAQINCSNTYQEAETERRILKSYGGGCHQKIGVTHLHTRHVVYKSLKGLTDQGEVLDELSIAAIVDSDLSVEQRINSPKRLNPAPEGFLKLTRRDLPYVEAPRNKGVLWVTRAEAWHAHWIVRVGQVVATAGIETWKKLAQMGIWVSGTTEGLGVDLLPQFDFLLGSDHKVYRLTHLQSSEVLSPGEDELRDGFAKPMVQVATYAVDISVPEEAELKKYNAYYWRSGSQFQQALRVWPDLIHALHGCGPGQTLTTLQNWGVPSSHIVLSLSREDFLNKLSGASS